MSKPKNKRLEWNGLLIAVLMIAVAGFAYSIFSNWQSNKPQTTETSQNVRSCLEWKRSYPIINDIPSDGFNFNGGTWIVQLNNDGWKRINASVHTYSVSEIKNGTESKILDGTTFKGTGHYSLKSYDTVSFSGTGCVLITSEKDVFYKWARAKPKAKSS